MNPSPSPIASLVPVRSTVTLLQAALAAQIGALTHSADRLEQLLPLIPSYGDSIQNEIDVIHSAIDGLNTLYGTAGSTQLDLDSLTRRLRVTRAAAEKHHTGNIAACGREEKLREVLLRLVHSPDLSLENMEPETLAAIDEAKRLLYPDVS